MFSQLVNTLLQSVLTNEAFKRTAFFGGVFLFSIAVVYASWKLKKPWLAIMVIVSYAVLMACC